MLKTVRVGTAVLFWLINVWWLGSVVQALRYSLTGTFRVYSVTNEGVTHEAWGLTFSGTTGFALATGYLLAVVASLACTIFARGRLWLTASMVLLAWSLLFAGNSLRMSEWGFLQWWDWLNFAGVGIVIAHAMVNIRNLNTGQSNSAWDRCTRGGAS